MAAYKLVLIRHGESEWNQENRFCGWFDADLSETGTKEAQRGGVALKGDHDATCQLHPRDPFTCGGALSAHSRP